MAQRRDVVVADAVVYRLGVERAVVAVVCACLPDPGGLGGIVGLPLGTDALGRPRTEIGRNDGQAILSLTLPARLAVTNTVQAPFEIGTAYRLAASAAVRNVLVSLVRPGVQAGIAARIGGGRGGPGGAGDSLGLLGFGRK